VNRLSVPKPISGGILLSYKCNCRCRHCIYACSPHWSADWICEEDAAKILTQLSVVLRGKYADPDTIGVNRGIPFHRRRTLLELRAALEGHADG